MSGWKWKLAFYASFLAMEMRRAAGRIPGICVSKSGGYEECDVVEDGHVKEEYLRWKLDLEGDKEGPIPSVPKAEYGRDAAEATFLLTSDVGLDWDQPNVFVYGPGAFPRINLGPSTNGKKQDREIVVQFQCKMDVDVEMSVVLRPLVSKRDPIQSTCEDFMPPGGLTCQDPKAKSACKDGWMVEGDYCRYTCGRCNETKRPEVDESIVFSFVKHCKTTGSGDHKVQTIFGSEETMDVYMSTSQGKVQYVVKNGTVEPSFRANQSGAQLQSNATKAWVVPSWVDFTSFLLASHNGTTLRLEEATATPEMMDVLGVAVSGNLAAPSTLTDEKPLELVVTYNCYKPGVSPVTVGIPIKGASELLFTYHKECGVDDPQKEKVLAIPGLSLSFRGGDFAGKPILKDGVALAQYRKEKLLVIEDASVSAIVSAEQNTLKLNMRFDPDFSDQEFVGQVGDTHLDLAMPDVYVSDPDVLQVTTLPAAPFVLGSQSVELVVEFRCLKKGSSIFTVLLGAGLLGTTDFSMIKACKESESIPELDQKKTIWDRMYLPLNIGSNEIFRDDVVKEGSVQLPFQLQSLGPVFRMKTSTNASQPYVVPEGVSALNLHLYNTGQNSTINWGAPSIHTYGHAAIPTLSGKGVQDRFVTGNATATISVSFQCLSEGKGSYQMLIPVQAPSERPILLFFQKDCGKNETFVPGNVPGALNVGTSPGLADVVEDGMVQVLYQAVSKETWGTGRTVIAPDQDFVRIYLSLGSTDTPLELGKPYVTSFWPSGCRATLSGTAAEGGRMRRGQVLDLTIHFNCGPENGTGTILTSLPLLPEGSGRIAFSIRKRCSMQASKGRLPSITGVDVGTSRNASDVVQNGMMLPSYTFEVGKPVEKYLTVPSNTTKAEFFIRVSGSTDGSIAQKKRYRKPIALAHLPFCNPVIEGDMSSPGWLSSDPQQLQIIFNCVWEGQTPVTVLLPMESQLTGNLTDMDTNNGTVARDASMLSFTVLKDCQIRESDKQAVGTSITLDGVELEVSSKGQVKHKESADGLVRPKVICNTADCNQSGHNNESSLLAGKYQLDSIGMDVVGADLLCVGTSATGSPNVVMFGKPAGPYKLCEEQGDDCPMAALFSQDVVSFWVSSPNASVVLGRPLVYVDPSNHVMATLVDAKLWEGQQLLPGRVSELRLQMVCSKQGTLANVLVSVPYNEISHAQFRFTKVCGTQSPGVAADRSLQVGVLLVASLLLLGSTILLCRGKRRSYEELDIESSDKTL